VFIFIFRMEQSRRVRSFWAARESKKEGDGSERRPGKYLDGVIYTAGGSTGRMTPIVGGGINNPDYGSTDMSAFLLG
jgi:hypothetical protein